MASVTVRELAEELGVSTQTIRRYAKAHDIVATSDGHTWRFDANQASIIADHFTGRKQAIQEPQHAESDEIATLLRDMSQKVATLEERCNGLERENTLLRERLEYADQQLALEQARSGGFWARLGQRLLGDGKKSKPSN